MTHPSKIKGNGFEREIVRDAENAGIQAVRCYGSDGRSRGLAKDVDVVIGDGIKLQAKRKRKLPSWLGLSEEIDGVVLREDRGETVVVMRWDDYLKLLKHTITPVVEVA